MLSLEAIGILVNAAGSHLVLRGLEELWEQCSKLLQMLDLIFTSLFCWCSLPFFNKVCGSPAQLLGLTTVLSRIIWVDQYI